MKKTTATLLMALAITATTFAQQTVVVKKEDKVKRPVPSLKKYITCLVNTKNTVALKQST
ncbi:hypothetical protein [Mucilaginibacter humi]|uniref:hypothetical protein n=1 Tax=Mucilaginibacter humi TaxID=2732510 RepID=UPI001C2E9619|nr:hypothetical protein [Mucilaginibacter humi]